MRENTTQSGLRRTPLDHDVLRDLKLLVDAGELERIVLRDGQGHPLLEVPVTAGTNAETLAPAWAALGAVAAGGFDCTIEAEVRPSRAGERWR
jgi:hypothetical protein